MTSSVAAETAPNALAAAEARHGTGSAPAAVAPLRPTASSPHSHHTQAQGEAKAYARRRPEESVLYGVLQTELATFLARARARDRSVPRFVERELRGFLRCGILAYGVVRGQCGAVTFVQRFGDALNLNVHFHSLLLDGVYASEQDGALRFHPLPPPDDADVARVVSQVLSKHYATRGWSGTGVVFLGGAMAQKGVTRSSTDRAFKEIFLELIDDLRTALGAPAEAPVSAASE